MTMKHAFLIMAHGSLPLLRVLLSMLDDERNDIFLHIDRKSDMLDGAEPLVLSKARLFVLEQRVDVRWGNLSQIKAEYVLFEEALKHGPYAYYHLLSGQDLPIKSRITSISSLRSIRVRSLWASIMARNLNGIAAGR